MAQSKVTQDQKFWAAASYVWALSIIVLAVKKDDAYVRFNASQGFLLFLLFIILTFIPIIGWLLNIFVVVAMVLGVLKSLNGEKWELPLLADAAEKLGNWVIKKFKI